MNQDFRDLLAEFNAGSVEYLVVGAHALAVHGFVRATKDLDVWVRPHAANASRVVAALAAFGAPLHDLTAADMAAAGPSFKSVSHLFGLMSSRRLMVSSSRKRGLREFRHPSQIRPFRFCRARI
jgi:hypothetical protein